MDRCARGTVVMRSAAARLSPGSIPGVRLHPQWHLGVMWIFNGYFGEYGEVRDKAIFWLFSKEY